MRVARSVALAVLIIGYGIPLTTAFAATKVPVHNLSAKGGKVTLSDTVKNAKTCAWSSSPKVPGFDTNAKCKTGKVSRSAKFGANASTKLKDYTLTLTVKGKTATVDHLKVVEAGKSVTEMTTTSPTSTSTPTTTTASSTTTTTLQVTTTTEAQIYDQPTSTIYSAILSFIQMLGSYYYATEWAEVTIDSAGYPYEDFVSPDAGTVSFYDDGGNLICTGTAWTTLGGFVSCTSGKLTVAPSTPIKAVYSGTQFGQNDGLGTSYAGSFGYGYPA